MIDYSTIIAKRRQNAVLDQIIAECVRLKDSNIPTSQLDYDDRTPENEVISAYNRLKHRYTFPTKDRCQKCEYAYDISNYRCVNCHNYRELEPLKIELPIELLLQILRFAEVDINKLSRGMRQAVLPEIIGRTLRNLHRIPIHSSIRIRFNESIKNFGKMGIFKHSNYIIPYDIVIRHCLYNGTSYLLITNVSNDISEDIYYIHTDVENTKEWINEQFEFSVTNEQVEKAFIPQNKNIGFRVAYAIARAIALDKDISIINPLRFKKIQDTNFDLLEVLIQRLS